MNDVEDPDRYRYWLGKARAHSRISSESEDLLHNGLVIALQRSVFPLQSTDHDAWFDAVLRKQAAFQARSAVRARQREQPVFEAINSASTSQMDHASRGIDSSQLQAVPPAQRSVLLLALHGLNRAEIRQVLDLSDEVLRQRLSALRRSVFGAGLSSLSEPFQHWLASRGHADTGLRRAALARGSARLAGFRLGISDPDGHLVGIHAPRKIVD